MTIKVPNYNLSVSSGLTFYTDQDIKTKKDLLNAGNKDALTFATGLPLGNIGLLNITYNLEGTIAGGADYPSSPTGLVENTHYSWSTDLSCAPYLFLNSEKSTALGLIVGIGYEQVTQENNATYYYDTDSDGYTDSYQNAWKIAYNKEVVVSAGLGFKSTDFDLKANYAYYLSSPSSSRIILETQWRNKVFSPSLTIGVRQDFSELSNLKLRGTFAFPFFIQYEYQKFAEKAVPATHTFGIGYEFRI